MTNHPWLGETFASIPRGGFRFLCFNIQGISTIAIPDTGGKLELIIFLEF